MQDSTDLALVIETDNDCLKATLIGPSRFSKAAVALLAAKLENLNQFTTFVSYVEQCFSDFNPSEMVVLLSRRYDESPDGFHIPQECLDRCTGSLGEVQPEKFDALAFTLARGYHEEQLTFAFCDTVLNILVGSVYSDAVAQHDTWPPLFWDVFLAFDAGEFHRSGEERVDPAEKYTRPLITAIIARQRA